MELEKLAILGGTPVKTTPFGTGKRFGEDELREVLEQETLFYWMGQKVKDFCENLAEMYGVSHCVAVSSGTAAIHAALGALGLTEGHEVIVPPITDMGTLILLRHLNIGIFHPSFSVGTASKILVMTLALLRFFLARRKNSGYKISDI